MAVLGRAFIPAAQRLVCRVLLLWCCLLSAAHALTLDELGARLRAQPPFRAALVQEKQLAALHQPLHARGALSFAYGVGLLYELDEPLVAHYAMSADRIVVREEGAAVRELRAQDLPWLQAITTVFIATMGGDWDALRRFFDVHLEDRPSGWQLRLEPREAALANAVKQVLVSGDAQVQRIELLDRNGDRTVIALEPGTAIAVEDLRRALEQR